MPPARTLRIAHLDTGRDWRGGQAQIALLLQGLARRGVTNALLAPPGPLLERARTMGIEATPWEPRGDWDVLAGLSAAAALRTGRFDVVHAHSARAHAVGVPAARMAGVRAVIVSRRVAVPVGKNPFSALKYRMPVDRYLCVSGAVMDSMRRSGISDRLLALVPSGVERSIPAASGDEPDLRELIGVTPDAPVIGTLAALTKEKRHEDLLEAAARVVRDDPEVHFAWLGEGPRREALERRRDELKLTGRVHLLGFRPDARRIMAQCTMVALASELEGIATSLAESQAAGVPVVATAVGGIPEVVEDGVTGRLVPPRDPAALAAALTEALRNPELARGWAERARDSVVRFDIETTVERTLREYQRAVGDRIPAA